MTRKDIEDKVAWYQTLTPHLQKVVMKCIHGGLSEIERRMRKLLDSYTKAGGFATKSEALQWLKTVDTSSIADLRRQLETVKDESVRKKLTRRIEADNYRWGWTREGLIRDTILIQTHRMAESVVEKGTPMMTRLAQVGFCEKSFEIQKSANIGFSIGGFPKGLIETAVTTRFDATTSFGFVSAVTDGMREKLVEGIVSGQSAGQIANAVIDRMEDRSVWVSKSFARTSICEVSAEAEKKAMDHFGIKSYVYRCTLDEVTCPVCGRLDGQHFLVSDAKAGLNYPPMHRNCRCTEVAYLTKEAEEGLERRARDENGRSITVPRSMTYQQWAKRYAPNKGFSRLDDF